jgi:hypothetical protein
MHGMNLAGLRLEAAMMPTQISAIGVQMEEKILREKRTVCHVNFFPLGLITPIAYQSKTLSPLKLRFLAWHILMNLCKAGHANKETQVSEYCLQSKWFLNEEKCRAVVRRYGRPIAMFHCSLEFCRERSESVRCLGVPLAFLIKKNHGCGPKTLDHPCCRSTRCTSVLPYHHMLFLRRITGAQFVAPSSF